MTLHLVKLCVGAHAVTDLEDWVRRRTAFNKKRGLGAVHDHETRMFPRRAEELLDGGSIYWVVKGTILVRQKIRQLVRVDEPSGGSMCRIVLDPTLVPTEARGRRAFQGWRYLSPDDAPPDLSSGRVGETPPALRAELAELGLL